MLACLLSRGATTIEFQSLTRLATAATSLSSSRSLSTFSTDDAAQLSTISNTNLPSDVTMPCIASPPPITEDLAVQITELSTASSGPMVPTAMSAIDSFHTFTGLPWWATIATVGFGIRTIMLPISLKGMKASAALFPLLQQARAEQEAEDKTTKPTNSNRHNNNESSTPTSTPTSAPSNAPNYTSILHRFHELRLQQGAPHPFWIIGSPLFQLPVFITVMVSIRSMALQRWPGFDTGGTAWFPDLTVPAMDFTTLSTPMGMPGVILPLTVAVAMYANIDAAFGSTERAARGNENSLDGMKQKSPSVMVYVMGKVRLALEWLVIPLFVTSLQLPHGAVCYWVTSSLYALGQNYALKISAVREALGLRRLSTTAAPVVDRNLNQKNTTSSKTTTTTIAAAEGGDSSAMDTTTTSSYSGKLPTGQHSATNGLNSSNNNSITEIPEDAAEGFARAAQLRATGDFQGAATVLKLILDSYPDQPRALFALGQVLSGLKDWGDASHAYLQAARFEFEPSQACRAWFGAGVALHMEGREEDAAEAFTRAASPEADEKLRVRAWVAGATLEEKLGRRNQAVKLLKAAAEIEPRVEEIYLKPLLEGKMNANRTTDE